MLKNYAWQDLYNLWNRSVARFIMLRLSNQLEK